MSLLEIEEAWEHVAAACPEPLPAETVGLGSALGRITAADARSAVDLPPFDRSAMDGYAVRAADTAPPRALELAGELAAGDVAADALAAGTALGITTGAALPPGADAILRVEDAHVSAGARHPGRSRRAGLHVRYRGEDVARGDVLAPAGTALGVHHLTALASAGVGAVAVHRRPVVHVLATGTELLELGAAPQPGRIHESNRLTLQLLGEQAGASVVVHPVVPDDAAATAAAVEGALAGDVLAISGGVSVGPHDYVKPALLERGVRGALLARAAQARQAAVVRPARRDARLRPARQPALDGRLLPALRRPGAAPAAGRDGRRAAPWVPARLAVPARPADGRTTLLTARLEHGADGVLEATPTEGQGSHLTGALAASDGFVAIPHDAGELAAGARVDALLL